MAQLWINATPSDDEFSEAESLSVKPTAAGTKKHVPDAGTPVAKRCSTPDDASGVKSGNPVSVPLTRVRGKARPAVEKLVAECGKANPDKLAKPRSADKTPRKKRGDAGTFAGRRPPKDEALRATFDSIKEAYHNMQTKNGTQKRKKMATDQTSFLLAMKKEIEADQSDASPQVKFQKALESWKQANQSAQSG